jgi:RNA-directed DNA polymerase
MMHEHKKSDSVIPAKKRSNKAGYPAAETVEPRTLAKGNSRERNAFRTQRRVDAPSALSRIRQVAKKDKRQRFTALLHHICAIPRLEQAYLSLKRTAASGVDGETWKRYGADLEANLRDLSERLQRGAYHAKPVRRVYVPKSNGKTRPLGVPTLEDKIVQRATVEVLNAIYEVDFAGFSYGFRPGRNQHQALDALSVGIWSRKINWVLDADIRSFFDTLKHEWIVKFVEHRVGDRRVVRLIQKWLAAGVLEGGQITHSEEGTVQGGSISPLLANLYLHYVFDLWAQWWRSQAQRGDVIVVRYADDFVMGFEHRSEAESFLSSLRERFTKFGLELHPDKTRLLEFGRFAISNRKRRGERRPETFDFLGLTHRCGRKRKGGYALVRETARRKMVAKLHEVKTELRVRMHESIPDQGKYLKSVISGHVRYYGVPGNGYRINEFRRIICRQWQRSLSRRSQNGQVIWERMKRLFDRWLPPAHICHPYPNQRLNVITQGKSRMR